MNPRARASAPLDLAPRVQPVCPSCKQELSFGDGEVQCLGCRTVYPMIGQAIDFIRAGVSSDKARQKAIYDGETEAGIQLLYREESEYRRILDERSSLLRRYGIPALSMKDAMNARLFRKLGFQPGMEVLDIGSGSGFLLNTLGALFGIRGTGLDLSSLAVRRCLSHNPHAFAFHLADAERLPFADASFDRVVSLDVLEHVSDQRAALAESSRVTKRGGKILFYAVSRWDDQTWHWIERNVTGGVQPGTWVTHLPGSLGDTFVGVPT